MYERQTKYVALFLVSLGLSACATPAQRAADKEDMLSAAGFDVRPANTPDRQDSLRRFPPNKLVQRASGDTVRYIYADPLVCNCLYVGDQQAYGRYRQNILQRRIADEQQSAAMLNQEAGWEGDPWGYGPW